MNGPLAPLPPPSLSREFCEQQQSRVVSTFCALITSGPLEWDQSDSSARPESNLSNCPGPAPADQKTPSTGKKRARKHNPCVSSAKQTGHREALTRKPHK